MEPPIFNGMSRWLLELLTIMAMKSEDRKGSGGYVPTAGPPQGPGHPRPVGNHRSGCGRIGGLASPLVPQPQIDPRSHPA